MKAWAAVALTLLVCLSSCRRAAGPAERYRAFAAAARAGDAASAWPMLSARTRAELDARAKALAARTTTGVVATSGRDLLLGDLAATAEKVSSALVVRESEGVAIVSVVTEGGGPAREVTLVREEGAWRVVVPFDN